MDNPLQGALQKMGSNFIVAAFVPAMAFILLSALAFFPVLPDDLVKYLGWSVTKPDQTTIVPALLFTTILGFTLFTLSNYIYKSFEGYTFILKFNTPLRRTFIQRQKRRIRKLEFERAEIEKELKKLNEVVVKESGREQTTPWLQRRLKRSSERQDYLKDRLYSIVAYCDSNFPPSKNLILPSRFGNILRAAEIYPGIRYKIDAVPLWGRMAHVIPPDAMDKIDQANNQCLFLLNSALLASVFTMLSIFASLYLACILLWPTQYSKLPSFMTTNLGSEHIGIYIVLAIFSGLVAWFFYEASLLNVSQFGSMIRTSYDLYRFDLLKKLNLELPKTLMEERTTWQKISEFMVGYDAFGKVDFTYHFAKDNSNADAPQEETITADEFFAEISSDTD